MSSTSGENVSKHEGANSAAKSTAGLAVSETAAVKFEAPSHDLPKAKHLHATVENVLTSMAKVVEELATLRECLTTPDVDNERPLYAELHRAANSLDLAVSDLRLRSKEAAFPSDSIKQYLAQARSLSLSASDATSLACEAMTKKTNGYVEGPGGSPAPSITEEISNNVVSEIGKLLNHSIKATHSVWAAMDLIQQLESSSRKPSTGSVETFWDMKKFGELEWATKDKIALGCILCVLLLTMMRALRYPSIFVSRAASADCALAGGVYTDLSKAYTLFHESYKFTASLQQSQHHKLDALDKRSRDIEEALQDYGIRIDNLWEALGPPNTNGTYYGAEAKETSKCDGHADRKLQELKEELERQVKKVEANTVALKKAMQMADIRVSGRLDKIERKRRGKC